MRTGSAFKLSKTAKRALAIIQDPEKRNAWRRCLVAAEATAQIQPRSRKSQ